MQQTGLIYVSLILPDRAKFDSKRLISKKIKGILGLDASYVKSMENRATYGDAGKETKN